MYKPTAAPSMGEQIKSVGRGLMHLAFVCLVLYCIIFLCQSVLAQTDEVAVATFFNDVMALINSWGGYTWLGKVGGVLALLIGATKISFVRPLWDKLGDFKIWAGPALGLVSGILMLGASSEASLSWAGVVAYVTAGFGAVAVHELFDLVKKIPGVSPVVTGLLDLLGILLRKPQP